MIVTRVLEVLNFEGLGPDESQVPDGYGGLQWKGADVYHPGSTGFGAKGLHSGDSVIYNENAQPMNLFSRSDWALKNGLFSAAQEKNVEVTFTGYLAGKEVASLSVTLNLHLTRVKFHDPAWTHINRLIITTDNAVNPSYSQITIDDLKLKVDNGAGSGSATADAHNGHSHQHLDDLTHDAHDLHALAYDAGGMAV